MTPIFKAEQSHIGGYLCRHNHRTISGAERCLPAAPRGQGAFSMAQVVPCNAAAETIVRAQRDAEEAEAKAAYFR